MKIYKIIEINKLCNEHEVILKWNRKSKNPKTKRKLMIKRAKMLNVYYRLIGLDITVKVKKDKVIITEKNTFEGVRVYKIRV